MNLVPPAFPQPPRPAVAVVVGLGPAALAAAEILAGVDCALRLAPEPGAVAAPAGEGAAEVARSALVARFPRARAETARAEDPSALLAGAGVALLATAPPALWPVHDAAVRAGVPAVILGASASALLLLTIRPGHGPCLRCLFDGVEAAAPEAEPETPALAALLGALAGAEALRLIRGLGPACAGRPLRHAPLAGWARASEVRARRSCALCGGGAP